ncbi:hypothetical protein CHCC14821_0488 [Bacillus paralicheniformis]|nr:hypothetical protein CHCC14821_0488 [Bacillus paralicheniformis]
MNSVLVIRQFLFYRAMKLAHQKGAKGVYPKSSISPEPFWKIISYSKA